MSDFYNCFTILNRIHVKKKGRRDEKGLLHHTRARRGFWANELELLQGWYGGHWGGQLEWKAQVSQRWALFGRIRTFGVHDGVIYGLGGERVFGGSFGLRF